MEPKMKFFYPKVKAIDKESRRITVCISKDEIDRHNERIEISAIADALQLYTTNPVVLGDHQHRLSTGQSSVIGHSPPEAFKVLENEVDVDIVFSVTENAETYWINYRDGHQRAVSIGFIDVEWRLDEEDGRKIFITTKLELLEVSCVAVGANRGALVKKNGMFDRTKDGFDEKTKNALVQALTEIISEDFADIGNHLNSLDNHIQKLQDFIQEELDEIKSLLIADPDGFAGKLLGPSSESPIPAGDKKKTERYVKAIENVTEKINL